MSAAKAWRVEQPGKVHEPTRLCVWMVSALLQLSQVVDLPDPWPGPSGFCTWFQA